MVVVGIRIGAVRLVRVVVCRRIGRAVGATVDVAHGVGVAVTIGVGEHGVGNAVVVDVENGGVELAVVITVDELHVGGAIPVDVNGRAVDFALLVERIDLADLAVLVGDCAKVRDPVAIGCLLYTSDAADE